MLRNSTDTSFISTYHLQRKAVFTFLRTGAIALPGSN